MQTLAKAGTGALSSVLHLQSLLVHNPLWGQPAPAQAAWNPLEVQASRNARLSRQLNESEAISQRYILTVHEVVLRIDLVSLGNLTVLRTGPSHGLTIASEGRFAGVSIHLA
jgi:hypothetical protein